MSQKSQCLCNIKNARGTELKFLIKFEKLQNSIDAIKQCYRKKNILNCHYIWETLS